MKRSNLFFFIFVINFSIAQNLVLKAVNEQQQSIPYAQFFFPELEYGGNSNEKGIFNTKIEIKGTVLIQISAAGYSTIRKEINIEKSNYTFQLKQLHFYSEDEFIVKSSFGNLQSENTTALEIKKLDELNQISASTLGENLGKINGVQVMSLGKGISKPVVRGLSGIRVLTYFDGLRMENQQWGSDHGLGVSSSGIGAIEVIKGPGSLLYGSDAIGGVIYFSEKPFSSLNTLNFIFNTGFESNTLGSNTDFYLGLSKEKFKINIYGEFLNHADYQIPDGRKVINSRFYTANGGVNMRFNKKNWFSKLRYNYLLNSNGIPGHTHDSIVLIETLLSDNRLRLETVPNQKIHTHSIFWENKWFLNKSNITLSVGNTNNNLAEHDEKITIPAIKINLNNTFFNALWHGKYGKNVIHAGIQKMIAFSRNDKKAEEILIPNSNQIDVGLYGVFSRKFNHWNLQAGIRYDTRFLSADTILRKNYNGFNFSIGTVYKKKPFLLRLNFSSGFRPPHISELLANGPHHGSTRYEIGDKNLNTENSFQFDASLRLSFEHIDIFINPFYNYIRNYIFLNPSDSLINGYEVFNYKQSPNAHLFGGEFGLHLHPHFAHWLHWETNISYVYTDDGQEKGFPYTPPASINNLIKLNFKLNSKKNLLFNTILSYTYLFEQHNLAYFEFSSKQIHQLDLGFNLNIDTKTKINFKWGIKNILNYNFVPHLSNLRELKIPNGGYNIYLGVQIELKHKLKK